jgi:hypothetical protein
LKTQEFLSIQLKNHRNHVTRQTVIDNYEYHRYPIIICNHLILILGVDTEDIHKFEVNFINETKKQYKTDHFPLNKYVKQVIISFAVLY